MKENRLRVIGIDISPSFASVSAVLTEGKQPQPVSFRADDGEYTISPGMYFRKSTNQWLIGDEAVFAAHNEEGGTRFLAENVFRLLDKGMVAYIGEKEYDSKELFCLYLKELYEKIKNIVKFEEVEQIVFTANHISPDIIKCVRTSFSELGFQREQIRFLTHTEAFVFYVVHGKKELWANDVTLFYMDEKKFISQNLSRRNIHGRNFFFVEEEDLSSLIQYDRLSSDALKAQADEKFLQYLKTDYQTHIVSSVYFTGPGFFENWHKKSIGEICRKRRAFQGANLYADGAASCVFFDGKNEFSLYCSGRTIVSIGIYARVQGEEREFLLSSAGINWTEAGKSAEFILDDTDQITFIIRSPFDGKKENLNFCLNKKEYNIRRDKTMCVRVSVQYEDEKTFEITVEDMGFGEFFPPSGMVIKKRISL